MKVHYKNILLVLLLVAAVGAFTLGTESGGLFKGQLSTNIKNEVISKLPDLVPILELRPPEEEGGDLKASATIENIGEGQFTGPTFRYTLSINGTEILSNSDSYSEMLPGDAFNFVYPIPQSIYQYPNEGTVSLVVDIDDSVDELNEDNNETTQEYSYSRGRTD